MKDLRTMTRKSLFKTIASTLFVASAIIFSACGNDDEVNNNNGISDGKMDAAKGMVFKVNFADYNSTDTLQTRSAAKNDTLAKEVVELSNGLLAEVTIKKDTENLKHEATTTRALADDTYTMLAYRGGILRGELKGTVSGGVFTPAAGGPADMQLPVGYVYDFVLFNSAITRTGNTLEVVPSNLTAALIGRTTYYVRASPSLQEVPFNMEHTVARVKIQIYSDMGISGTTTAILTTDKSIATYDILNKTWSISSGATSLDGALTFPTTGEESYVMPTHRRKSDGYAYFHASTNPSDLKLKFEGGRVYNVNLAGVELKLSVPTLTAMLANGSYLIEISLKPNFLYLMSDGTTGFFNKTTYGGGTKTPIGLVVSQSNRLAVALGEANNGSEMAWNLTTSRLAQKNYRLYSANKTASYTDMDGYKYTWEASGSLDGTTIKGNEQTDFPAFYYAGHYGDELVVKGIRLSGGMENKKWYLPSTGEWKYVLTALGFGDGVAMTNSTDYNGNYKAHIHIIEEALKKVGGTSVGNRFYWSSSEFHDLIFGYPSMNYYSGGTFYIGSSSIRTGSQFQDFKALVRAFVKY